MANLAIKSTRSLTSIYFKSPTLLLSYSMSYLMYALIFSLVPILNFYLIIIFIACPRSLNSVHYLRSLAFISLPIPTLVTCFVSTLVSHLMAIPISYL